MTCKICNKQFESYIYGGLIVDYVCRDCMMDQSYGELATAVLKEDFKYYDDDE